MTSPPATQPVRPRLSRLAVASLGFALLGAVCEFWYPLYSTSEGPLWCLLSAAAALVLGIAALWPRHDPRRRASGLWMAVIGLLLSLPLAFFANHYPREDADRTSCLSSLRRLAYALNMYAQDNDGRLPPASGWCDLIWPYCSYDDAFTCPTVDHRPKPRLSDYAFNDRLGGLRVKELGEASPGVVLLFDADRRGWNLHGGPELLGFRHWKGFTRGANLCFLNGKARWAERSEAASLQFTPPSARR